MPFQQRGIESVVGDPHDMLKEALGGLYHGNQPRTAAWALQGCCEKPEELCQASCIGCAESGINGRLLQLCLMRSLHSGTP